MPSSLDRRKNGELKTITRLQHRETKYQTEIQIPIYVPFPFCSRKYVTDLHEHPQSNNDIAVRNFLSRENLSSPGLAEVREIPSGIKQEICKKGPGYKR